MKDLILKKELPLGVIVIFTTKGILIEHKIRQILSFWELDKLDLIFQAPCEEFGEGFIITRRLNLGNVGHYATISFNNIDFDLANQFDFKDFAEKTLDIVNFDNIDNIELKYEPPTHVDDSAKFSLRKMYRRLDYVADNPNEDEEYDSTNESLLDKCLSIFDKPDLSKINKHETNIVDKVESDKRHYIDLISTLVLDYVAKYHEMPPMEDIHSIVKGNLCIQSDKLSPLCVDTDLRIRLTDYDDVEFKFTPLLRSIYILFLLHPEGIILKQIGDYRSEIESIYLVIKPGRNNRLMKASIDDICDPLNDSLRQKLSKINRIVRSVICDKRVAKSYSINGHRGTEYNIPLDKHLRKLPNIFTRQ